MVAAAGDAGEPPASAGGASAHGSNAGARPRLAGQRSPNDRMRQAAVSGQAAGAAGSRARSGKVGRCSQPVAALPHLEEIDRPRDRRVAASKHAAFECVLLRHMRCWVKHTPVITYCADDMAMRCPSNNVRHSCCRPEPNVEGRPELPRTPLAARRRNPTVQQAQAMWDMALEVEDGTLIDIEGEPDGNQEAPDGGDVQERMPGRRRRRGQRLPVEVC